MALTTKKPPCCCGSLREASMQMLYFNLVISAYSVIIGFSSLLGNHLPVFIKMFGMHPTYIVVINLIFAITSCLIFLLTIYTIYKESPSFPLLTASVCVLLLSAASSLCLVIWLSINGNMNKTFHAAVNSSMEDLAPEKRDGFAMGVGWMSGIIAIIGFAVIFSSIVFQLYSALIIHSYKEDLKQTPAYSVPPQHYNPDGKEVNVSAPYPSNV